MKYETYIIAFLTVWALTMTLLYIYSTFENRYIINKNLKRISENKNYYIQAKYKESGWAIDSRLHNLNEDFAKGAFFALKPLSKNGLQYRLVKISKDQNSKNGKNIELIDE